MVELWLLLQFPVSMHHDQLSRLMQRGAIAVEPTRGCPSLAATGDTLVPSSGLYVHQSRGAVHAGAAGGPAQAIQRALCQACRTGDATLVRHCIQANPSTVHIMESGVSFCAFPRAGSQQAKLLYRCRPCRCRGRHRCTLLRRAGTQLCASCCWKTEQMQQQLMLYV